MYNGDGKEAAEDTIVASFKVDKAVIGIDIRDIERLAVGGHPTDPAVVIGQFGIERVVLRRVASEGAGLQGACRFVCHPKGDLRRLHQFDCSSNNFIEYDFHIE